MIDPLYLIQSSHDIYETYIYMYTNWIKIGKYSQKFLIAQWHCGVKISMMSVVAGENNNI